METNYVLLTGLFLLLLAVDCSSSDPKGDVNGKVGVDQNVDSKVDPVKENVDSKSVSDSIGVNKVKDNGGDQVNVSEGGIDGDASKSNLKQQSGSNESENLKKDGKESSAEAKGKTDDGKDGENVPNGLEESQVEVKGKTDGGKDGENRHNGREETQVEVKGKTDGGKDGENAHNGQEESHIEVKEKTDGGIDGENAQNGGEESHLEAKRKTDGGKDGENVHNAREESHIEAKGKTDGGKDGENVHNAWEESHVEGKGKTGGEKKGDNEHKGREESHVEIKEKIDDEKEGDNMQKGQEESNVEDKGKTDVEREGNNVLKGQEESNFEEKGKKDGEREGNNVHKGQEESNLETKGKTDDEKKENPDDSVDPKKVTNEKDNIQDSIPASPPPPQPRNDGFRGEECDSSNMCMDENKRFAACLRVPGNESPDLSLLIQNKGKGPLTLKISAPAFVQLEETDVEIQEKQDKKVKVSIKNSGTENLIVIKDGSGKCSLDFKDYIVHNSAESYVNFLSQTPTTAFIFVVAILILASGWICMSFRRRQLTRSGLKYRRLDMELPVSGGAKTQPDVNDGWNNSWGDNWDDEEAAMTPSMPVTPSLSSKGLASRRLSKEGWKD